MDENNNSKDATAVVPVATNTRKAQEKFVTKTPMQKLLSSLEWDAAMIIVIILNCIWIAWANPRLSDGDQPYYIKAGQNIFSVIFIIELFLKVLAFGLLKYWSDAWNWLDTVVVLEAIIGYIIMLVSFIKQETGGSSGIGSLSVIRFLRILRLTRLLRPLKTIKMVPTVRIYVEAFGKSIESFFLNMIVLFVSCMAIAFILHEAVDNALQFRCVPTNTSDPNVYENAYYQAYDVDYFYSSYNNVYCTTYSDEDFITSSNAVACSSGFSCLNINNASSTFFFPGAGADFSNTFNAFVASMSFLTFRGWPHIYWAIHDSLGIKTAFGILVLVFSNALLIVNLFPAIFLSSLKSENVARRKAKWLSLYPGNKRTVSEFELMIWANANMEFIHRSKHGTNGGAMIIFWKIFLMLIPCKSWKNQLIESEKSYDPVPVSEGEEDDEALANNDGATEPEDPLDIMEAETHEHMCVPRGRLFLKLRRVVFDETSLFNQSIMLAIVLNISFMAFDSDLFPKSIQTVSYISNIIFICIYIAEALFKIGVLGPFLYFDNPFNMFDLILVLISLPSFASSSGPFKVFSNFRILRMLRLARVIRVARLYRVVKNVYKTRDKSVHNTTITPGKLFGMILEFFPPMFNVVFLNLLVSFVFACLGMSFFANVDSASDYPYDSIVEAKEVSTAPLQSLFFAWGAKYTPRMNFHNFGNAFITVYNFGVLNNWYYVMINAIRHTSTGVFAYFFVLLFCLYYVPQSTLLASVVSIIEVTANQSLVALADDNEVVLKNVGYVNVRCHARLMIKKWQKNSMQGGENSSSIQAENKQRRPEVKEVQDVGVDSDPLSEFLVVHKDHALYLFDTDHWLRKLCTVVLQSRTYSVIYLIAICMSCIPSILSAEQMTVPSDKMSKTNNGLLAIFALDMLMGFISTGMIGSGAYFDPISPLHYVDVAAIVFEIAGYFNGSCQDIYLRLLLLRLLKVPALLQRTFSFLNVGSTVTSIEASIGSILSVVLISSVLGFFFAIIACQNYSLTYNYCSSPYFPPGEYRYSTPDGFPNGCSGVVTIVTNTTNVTDTNVHWKSSLDSFDDIFTSSRSILRLMTFNEWQGIIYSGLDAVDIDYNPKPYQNRAAFIFFLLMGLVAGTFSFLGVAVIYYHYFIETAKRNRKIIFGSEQAFWANYEERLRVVQNRKFPDVLNKFCRKSAIRRLCAVFYVLFPYCLFFSQSSKYEDFTLNVTVDWVFNIMFIVFACSRIVLNRVPFTDSITAIELGIAIVLLFFLISKTATSDAAELQLCKAASFFRSFILVSFFEQLTSFFKIIVGAVTGFIPQVIFCIAILLIFGTLSFSFFHLVDIDFDNTFLEAHYNFTNFMQSLVTILGMATGNYWTEIIDAVGRGKSLEFTIAVDAFFTAFFIIFASIFRSFPLLVVYRYLVEAGGASDIAIQQVNQFNHGWEKIMNKKLMKMNILSALNSTNELSDDLVNNSKGGIRESFRAAVKKGKATIRTLRQTSAGRISLDDLMELLSYLPAPLGIKGQNKSYLDKSNACRNILLCMPMDGADVGRHDVPLFVEAYLPADMSMVFRALNANNCDIIKRSLIQTAGASNQAHVVDAVDSMFKNLQNGFSFTQVLIACHKRVVLFKSHDEILTREREIAIRRVGELKHRLARSMIINRPQPKNLSKVGYNQLLLLQRLDKQLYRQYFRSIIMKGIESIVYRTNAFQISQFDLFFMNKLRLAVVPEYTAAQLQLKLAQSLTSPGCNEWVIRNRDQTKAHVNALRKLNKQMEDLYSMNANNIWEISTLTECSSMGGKVGITALAVDSKSTVYAAFDNGDIKIYCTAHPENLGPATFAIQQKLTVESAAHSLAISPEGKQLFAGVGNSVIVFGWKSKRRLGRPQFTEVHRFSGHSDVPNFVLQHGPFNISGAQDGYVMLWDMNSADSIKYHNAGSAVYCGTRVYSSTELTSPELVGIPDFIVCGTRHGSLILLPLPALKNSSSDLATSFWPTVTQYTSVAAAGSNPFASSIAVTTVAICWGYLFVGLADGSVQTWSFFVNKEITYELIGMQFIKKIDIVRVNTVTWHAGPVTSIQFTGGYMFSGSYDLSILPWNRPEKLNVTQTVQYSQSTLSGMIFHTAPITAMVANRFQLVSANQDGKIIVTVPRVINDVTALGASNTLFEPDVSKYLKFSFLSYDFGACFIKHQKVIIKEKVVLNVTNTYTIPINLQVTAARPSPYFDFQFEHSLNPVGLLSQVKESKTSKSRDIISVLPFQTISFTISFIPEDEILYNANFEFLIESKKSVSIGVKGLGVKPMISVNGLRTFDFGTCIANSGGRKKLTLTLENPTPKDILVNTLDVEYVGEGPQPTYEDISFVSMRNRDITIMPECFVLKANGSISLHIAFRPRREYFPFEIDIRIRYCGATYTVGKILGRSETRQVKDSNGDASAALGSGVLTTDKLIIQGLRPLQPNESVLMVTKGPVLAHALRNIGWALAEGPVNKNDPLGAAEHVTCLLHRTSGVFIEFPPDIFLRTRKPQRSTIDRLQVKFDNRSSSLFFYCKLRHGRTEVSIGEDGNNDEAGFAFTARKFEKSNEFKKVLKKRIDELFLRDERDKRPGNPDLVGYSTVELILSNEEDFSRSEVLVTFHIRVQRGFRLQKTNQYEATDNIAMTDRINIIGFERVVTLRRTWRERKGVSELADIIEVTELFGRTNDDSSEEYLGNPMFGRVMVTVKNTDHMLHQCKIVDNVFSPGKPPHDPMPGRPYLAPNQPPQLALQMVDVKPFISSTEVELVTVDRPKYMLRQHSLEPDQLNGQSPKELHEENNFFNRSIRIQLTDEEGSEAAARGKHGNNGTNGSASQSFNKGSNSFNRTDSRINRQKTLAKEMSIRHGITKSHSIRETITQPVLTPTELAVQAAAIAKSAQQSVLSKLFKNVEVDLHVGIDVEHRALSTGLSVFDVYPRVLVTSEYTIDLSSLESIPFDEELDDDDVLDERKEELEDSSDDGKDRDGEGSDVDEEERQLRLRSDGLPNKQLARRVEDLIDSIRLPTVELNEDVNTPILDGNWFFVLEEDQLKLVAANPRVPEPELDPTELFLRDFGFHLSFCETHPETKVINRDCFIIPVEDPEESYKLSVMNSNGNACVPTRPPLFMSRIFEVVAKDEIQAVVKNYFKALARRRLDGRISIAQKEFEDRVAAFEKKLELEVSKRVNKRLLPEDIKARNTMIEEAKNQLQKIPSVATYKEVYEEILLCINNEKHMEQAGDPVALGGSSGAGDVAGSGGGNDGSGNADSNGSSKDADGSGSSFFGGLGLGLGLMSSSSTQTTKAVNSLEFQLLVNYLQHDKDVSGMDKVFTKGQAMHILDNLKPNPSGFVPIEVFKDWFEQAEGQALSNSLTQETMFSLLLHEHMTLRERTHINKKTKVAYDTITHTYNEVPYVREPKLGKRREFTKREIQDMLYHDIEVVSENEGAESNDLVKSSSTGEMKANVFSHMFGSMGTEMLGAMGNAVNVAADAEGLMTRIRSATRASVKLTGILKAFQRPKAGTDELEEPIEGDQQEGDESKQTRADESSPADDAKPAPKEKKQFRVGFFGLSSKNNLVRELELSEPIEPEEKQARQEGLVQKEKVGNLKRTATAQVNIEDKDEDADSDWVGNDEQSLFPLDRKKSAFDITSPTAAVATSASSSSASLRDPEDTYNSATGSGGAAIHSIHSHNQEFHASETSTGMYKFFGSKKPKATSRKSLAAEYELGIMGGHRAEVIDMYDSIH